MLGRRSLEEVLKVAEYVESQTIATGDTEREIG
jgi:hypothetical protein